MTNKMLPLNVNLHVRDASKEVNGLRKKTKRLCNNESGLSRNSCRAVQCSAVQSGKRCMTNRTDNTPSNNVIRRKDAESSAKKNMK